MRTPRQLPLDRSLSCRGACVKRLDHSDSAVIDRRYKALTETADRTYRRCASGNTPDMQERGESCELVENLASISGNDRGNVAGNF
jgi:hypothetical protein